MALLNVILILLINFHHSAAASVHVYNTTVTIDDDGQLSKCGKHTANTVKFLDPGGTSDRQQGFIAICLATMSRPPGWALFCDDGDDNLRLIGPMYAACRQQGFFGKPSSLSRSHSYSPVFKYIVFDVSCPIVNYDTEDGALVLARCTFGKVIDYSDGSDCHKYISVECNDKGSLQQAYFGQVRLTGSSEQTVRDVQLYARSGWGYVCIRIGTPEHQLGDSVCRQLGYTAAESTDNQSPPNSNHAQELYWQIDGEIEPTCINYSLPCFTQCWRNILVTQVKSCGRGYKHVQLRCKFDKKQMASMSSGSRALCQDPRLSAASDHYPMILAGLILSAIGITACIVLGILICCLYWRFRQIQQGRQQLQPDNVPNDDREN